MHYRIPVVNLNIICRVSQPMMTGAHLCSAGQICISSGPFDPKVHGSLAYVVHEDTPQHSCLSLREAVEVQLRHGSPVLTAKQRKSAAGFLLELLGLLPIQAVLFRDARSAGPLPLPWLLWQTGIHCTQTSSFLFAWQSCSEQDCLHPELPGSSRNALTCFSVICWS